MFDFTEYFETDNLIIFFKGEQTKELAKQKQKL